MRGLFCFLIILLGMGQSVQAGEKHRPSDAKMVTGWEAVGRLNIAGINMCTGALIGPDIVLTAAHCLYDTKTGKMVDPTRIEFLAGFDRGQPKASRRVARAIVHDKYRYRPKGQAQIGHDLAVLRLERPISGDVITPFRTEERPEKGDALGVIAYSRTNTRSPLLEEPCHVMARRHETLVMSCSVDFGGSGAPVLVLHGGQNPKLVSVISAKAMVGRTEVSVGTVLDQALKQLLRRAG